MWLAVLIPIVATALGTALALGARDRVWVLEPVRSFALAAVTLTIVLHLMPEAVDEAGPWALAVLAGGLVLPGLAGWAAPARGHGVVAVELSFLGVVAHQIGDGLGLGAVTGEMHDGHTHWDFFVAIGAHTIPLAAVVALTFASRDGRRAAIVRAAVLALAPLIGLAATRVDGADSISPWLNAAVSGLLLHVLAHDLPSAATRSTGVRTAELLAIAAGIALPLVFSHHEDVPGIADRIPGVLRALALAGAPALLAGIAIGAVVHAMARRAHVGWLAGGSGPGAALRGAILGVPLPPCSCDVVPVAGELRHRGGGAAFVTSFVLGAPQLGLAALLLGVALLGWQLALVRVLAGVLAAVVAGVITERVTRDRGRAITPAALPPGPTSIASGVDDLIAHDGAWIAVGLTVAAFLLAASPPDALAGSAGTLLVLALAAPLTISATAATPIAFALIASGLAPGAGVAAILLASTINLTTVAHLRRTFGAAAAGAAALVVVAIAVAVTLAVDALALTPSPVELGSEPLAIACGLAVLALAAASLWRHGLAHWLAALRGADHGHDHDHGLEEHHHDHRPSG